MGRLFRSRETWQGDRLDPRRYLCLSQLRGARYGGAPDIGDTQIYHYLPGVRSPQDRDDADGRLPVVLRLSSLRGGPQAQARRLLRVLRVRDGALAESQRLELVLGEDRLPFLQLPHAAADDLKRRRTFRQHDRPPGAHHCC